MQLQPRAAFHPYSAMQSQAVGKPYALIVYERFQQGATIEELCSETGIPRERLVQRLRAAAAFIRRKATA